MSEHQGGVMGSEVQPKLHLVYGDGTFNLQGLEDFAKQVNIYDKGMSYAVVAIMGPQSSGKSTLLNSLFKTKFEMMDFLKGRGQTTKGIWMAPANVDLETFTLVLDLEGTDGRERGEDDTAFEKQSTLFALATADVIIVNMWCHDIGREHAANKPLLKTVFQVMLRLFLPRKATLLFIIRDKTRTPIESLEPILREDLEKIWVSVPKPEDYKDSSISDFFNVEVSWLPNFEEKEEEFLERVGMLRERFQRSITAGGIAGDRSAVVPAQALPLSMQGIWDKIKHNRDLDLPAHKVMVATVRCEQIADEKLELLLASEEWEGANAAVKSSTSDPSKQGLGTILNSLVTKCLSSYDSEAAYFEEKVKQSKKEQLISRLKEVLVPVHSAAVSSICGATLEAFKVALEAATGGEDGSAAKFAESARQCRAEAAAALDKGLEGMGVPLVGLEVESARATFLTDLDKHVTELRSSKLKMVEENAVEFLLAGLLDKVGMLLEGGKPDAWARIAALWGAQMGQCRVELKDALEGFELGAEEEVRLIEAVEARGLKGIEEKTREMAKGALALMKDKFTAVFMYDAQGMPRRFSASVDVSRLRSDARLATLGALAAVAAVQLEPRSAGGASTQLNKEAQASAGTNPVLSRLMPLLDEDVEDAALSPTESQAESGTTAVGTTGSGGEVPKTRNLLLSKGEGRANSLRLWDGVPAALTLLSPEDCRALWKQFKKDTAYLVAQALQAQEASRKSTLPPVWAMAAMVVLGFNEFWALLRNPLLALLLAALFFFGQAVWKQVAGDDVFRHGMVPGLVAISSRLLPAITRIFQHFIEGLQKGLDALGSQEHRPHNVGQPSSVDSNGVGSGEVTKAFSSSADSQQLRHRQGAVTQPVAHGE